MFHYCKHMQPDCPLRSTMPDHVPCLLPCFMMPDHVPGLLPCFTLPDHVPGLLPCFMLPDRVPRLPSHFMLSCPGHCLAGGAGRRPAPDKLQAA